MKRTNNYLYLVLAFWAVLISNTFIQAQLNVGGVPISNKNNKIKALSDLKYETMPSFDVQAMIKEDSLNIGHGKTPFRFAKGFQVSYSLTNSGTWETLNNGDKLWRLGIKSPKAYSLNIIFSEYNIPDGAQVFIFSQKNPKQ